MMKLFTVIISLALIFGYVKSAKTPGQLLDDAIRAMRANSNFLANIFSKRLDQMEKEKGILNRSITTCAHRAERKTRRRTPAIAQGSTISRIVRRILKLVSSPTGSTQ